MKPAKSEIIIKGIRINWKLLEKRFAPCDLHACRHACCYGGAVLGTVRIAKITKLLPKLIPMMRAESVKVVQSKGFYSGKEFKRSDLDQSHKHYNFRIVKGNCIFITYDNQGGCVLQKYEMMHNMKYQLKPEGCYGFPYDVNRNRLTMYNWKCLPCIDDKKNKNAPLAYKTCRVELEAFLGKDGYKELLAKAAAKAK